MGVEGKKLLVLGGTTASLDLLKNANEMGVYTIVAAEDIIEPVRALANESVNISTIDHNALKDFIISNKIDGVFCGPSEFNIRNMLMLCEKVGLPCYTTTEVWDHCANKDFFKEYCRKYGVDCTPEYDISEGSSDAELKAMDYPIIVKPVDGCSSAGITTCSNWTEVRSACIKARAASKRKKIIVEKYIDNQGELFSVRYLLSEGEAFPYFLIDTYIADPINKKSLISHVTLAPSKYSKYYMDNMDMKVRQMLKGMGLKNGTAFIQSLPYNGKIYFHEMGYRLSGGMIFKLTEPLVHINDMKMMIGYALGENYYSKDTMSSINLKYNEYGAQLMIPLLPGKIHRIEGLSHIMKDNRIIDFIQYYHEGDTISEKVIGTLGQHFGRFTMVGNSFDSLMDLIENIQSELKIIDESGNVLNSMTFSKNRV